MLTIADDGSRDYIEVAGQDGTIRKVVDQEHITRARLKVDTRKSIVSKMLPNIYGDHTTTEIKGTVKIEDSRVDKLELARWVHLVLTNGVDHIKQGTTSI